MAGERLTDFVEWARRARAKPTFDVEERGYRLSVAEALRDMIDAAVAGRPLRDKVAAVAERVMDAEVTLVQGGQVRRLIEWADRDEAGLAQALRDFSAAGDNPEARLERFLAAIASGPGVDRFAGGGLVVGSLLNFAAAPDRWPVARPARYLRLQELLGESQSRPGSAMAEYRRFLDFASRVESALRDAAVPVRDMIDVESLITICSMEEELWAGEGDATGAARASEPDVYLAMWTLFRNEADYLAEWIEFHMLVGVERFFLYDNESTDQSRDVLTPYIEEGVVVRHEWAGSGTESRFALHSLQRSSSEHCLSAHGAEARWIAFIDLDEFLFSPTGRSLPELLAEYERWPAVAVNSAVFGTSGHVARPTGLVLENYMKRLDTDAAWRAGRRVKNVVDPAAVKRCDSVHRFEYTRGTAVDENGYPVPSGNTKSLSLEKLRINHYFARSAEDLRVKHERRSRPFVPSDALAAPDDRLIAASGVAEPGSQPVPLPDLEPLVQELSSGIEEVSIARYVPALRAALARRMTRSGAAMQRFATSMAALEPLVDPQLGVGHELTTASKTMLISFAAMSSLKPPPFHMFETTSGLPVKRLFVRDPALVWFQRGVPGFGDTIDEVAASLKSILDEQEVERLVVMGSSAGGYAALAFGALLEADLVLSFSPQTILDRSWLDEIGDERWPGRFKDLAALGGPDPRWVDLREALSRERRDGTEFAVHYPSSQKDGSHAEHLRDLPGVTMIGYERASHSFIQGLRDRGELVQIFRSAGIAT